jgi:hypothetical protein
MSSENPAAKHGVEFDVDTRSVMHVQAQTLREVCVAESVCRLPATALCVRSAVESSVSCVA